jgi:ribonucleotide reductase beta subunit family protein with ferritin-like domain
MSTPFSSHSLLNDEPLLMPTGRKSIFPIQHPNIWKMYKKAQSSNWTAEEIKFSNDLADWEVLDDDTKEVVKTILGFFSGADMIVNENLAENMMNIIDIPEVRSFYGFQIMIENVHGETYSLMIENLIKDREEKARLLDAVNTMPGVRKLYDWAQRWLKLTPEDELRNNPILKQYLEEGAPDEVVEDLAYIWCIAKKIVAFACVEGIMFSGAFAVIYYLKERGILPGLTFSNELISRDEGLHRDFACLMYSMIKHTPPQDQILEIVKEAVEFKQELIAGCMDRLRGLNRQDMKRYIEFVGDSLLTGLNMPKYYKVTNPFDFMEKISFNGITNFFEKRVGDYSTAGFEEGNDDPIELDDDY